MSADALTKKVEKLLESYASIDEPEFVKSGSVVLDALLGGGVPRGCFILWSSSSGIGKSTGSLYVCKSYCMQGKKVLYIDFEGAVNDNQLEGIGLKEFKYDKKKNPSGTFFIFQAHTFRDAEIFLDTLLTEVDLVIFDSVTAMLPSKLREKSVEDVQPGVQARMMSALLLKYKALSVKNGVTWIMINQTRTKIRFIGVSTEEEAGGLAVKFWSDYRIIMKESRKLTTKELTPSGEVSVPYGSENEIMCIKSRYTRPFIPLPLTVVFGKGVSNVHAYKDFLELKGNIRRTAKKGGWYEIRLNDIESKEPDVRVNGEEAVFEYIRTNKDKVREMIKGYGGYNLIMKEKNQLEGPDVPEDTENYYGMLSEEEQEMLVSGEVESVEDLIEVKEEAKAEEDKKVKEDKNKDTKENNK